MRIQAYFPKSPGNFVPLFLMIPHGAGPRSGVGLHHQHMERGPHRFFSEKMSDAFFRIAPLGKVNFSRGGGGMGPPRSA